MKKLLTPIVVMGVLTGCQSMYEHNNYQPRPLVEAQPKLYQQKFAATAHWNILAENEAKLISSSLASGKSVNIEDNTNASPFASAYKKLLTAELAKSGISTSVVNDSSLPTVVINTQVVEHKDNDSMRDIAGLYSGAIGAAYLIGSVAESNPGLALFALAGAYDLYNANIRDGGGKIPNTEVLVSTEIQQGNLIKNASARVYYFNSGNKSLYKGKPKPLMMTAEG